MSPAEIALQVKEALGFCGSMLLAFALFERFNLARFFDINAPVAKESRPVNPWMLGILILVPGAIFAFVLHAPGAWFFALTLHDATLYELIGVMLGSITLIFVTMSHHQRKGDAPYETLKEDRVRVRRQRPADAA